MARILIIEDEIAQRKALVESLIQNGFSVLEARDGVEGLQLALNEHPDIVLLDIRMPRMDGMTMMHKLREDSWGKNASIMILTNYDINDAQLLQITIDLPTYYLLKANCSLESIVVKIQEILETKGKEARNLQKLQAKNRS